MTKQTSSAGSVEAKTVKEEWVERGRRCVFGYLCPMILHETNNVLTVMSGVRQLLGQGRNLSDRIGPMLDNQLEKMDQLLGWIHGLNADEAGSGPRSLEDLCTNLGSLISLASKGRRLKLTTAGTPDPIPGPAFEVLALGGLCSVLPLVPDRAPGVHVEVGVEAVWSELGFGLHAEVEPAGVDLGEDPDVRLGAGLVRAHGGTFSCSRTPEGRGRVELAIP